MSEAWRKVGTLTLMAGFLVLTTATSKPKKTGSSTSSSSSSSSSSSGTYNNRPSDLDVILLNSVLGCSRSSVRPGCKLLQEFDDASTWVDVPAAESVYYGETIGIGDVMDGKRLYYFLQIGAGGPGQFTGAARELYPDNQKERDDAARLLLAVHVGSTAPGSEAAKFMHTSQPTTGRSVLTLTNGKSHKLGLTYLRKKGNRVLFVEYSGGSPLGDPNRPGRTATAWVGELFKLNQ